MREGRVVVVSLDSDTVSSLECRSTADRVTIDALLDEIVREWFWLDSIAEQPE